MHELETVHLSFIESLYQYINDFSSYQVCVYSDNMSVRANMLAFQDTHFLNNVDGSR